MEFMYCEKCNGCIWYDNECTLYLKCPECDNVLIDKDLSEMCRNYGDENEYLTMISK